jgi:hypothetical protein
MRRVSTAKSSQAPSANWPTGARRSSSNGVWLGGSEQRAVMSKWVGSANQSRDRKRRSVVAVTLSLHFGPLRVRKL